MATMESTVSLGTILHFKLSDAELACLSGLTSFEQVLVSCLYHTFQLGVHLGDKGTAKAIDQSTASGSACKKLVAGALTSSKSSDTLLSVLMQWYNADFPLPSRC